jgi:hypothetical protein
MSRIAQPAGDRGSLKWIQRLVNRDPSPLDRAILARLPNAQSVIWRSPLASDDYAEYRDGDFLNLLDLPQMAPHLESFWPRRGPQWDALGVTDNRDVLLVEAKAHIPELHSPPSKASPLSLKMIRASLDEAASSAGVPAGKDWHGEYYQLANRLAHLYLLRRHAIPAWLILVNFLGDADMRGPKKAEEWEAAYLTAQVALGLSPDAVLLRHVLHVYLDVRELA